MQEEDRVWLCDRGPILDLIRLFVPSTNKKQLDGNGGTERISGNKDIFAMVGEQRLVEQ